MARTTCGLLGGRLGLKLGNSHVKSLFNLLVAVDFNSGFDGYYNAFAGFVSQLLTSQGLLRGNLDSLFAPCLEAIFLSISKTLNFDIDIAAALDIALAVDVNLDLGVGADVGLSADVGLAAAADVGVGVNVGAGVNAGGGVGAALGAELGAGVGAGFGTEVGLDVDADVGVGADLDVNANVGLGVDADLGLGLDADLGLDIDAGIGLGVGVGAEVDIAAKFGLELLSRLRNSKILENLGLKSISKKQLFSLSKLVVGLLSRKFNMDLGNSILKYLFKLFLSVNINRGFDGYYNIFAKFMSRLFMKQRLLNNDFDKLLPSCLEVFFLAISRAFNVNIDIASALNVALGVDVGAGLGIGAAVGVDAQVGAGVGVGVDAQVGAGVGFDVGAGVGVGVGAGAGVDIGAGVGIGAGIDVGANVGVDVDAAVGLDVDVQVDFAARLGQLLVSSEEFNLALLSRNRESVLSVISTLIAESYGDEAGNAFASSCGM